MTESNTTQEKLLAPFPESDLEWRVQSAGEKNGKTWCKVLVYVTNRAIMERLDSVFGINGWQNEFKPLDGGGYLCGISCKFGDEWVIKWDGADKTDIEATKGGISSAMKRAGVQWGIGRYLYNVTVMWGDVSPTGKLNGQWKDKTGGKHYFKYNSPKLPTWALPNTSKNTPESPPQAPSDELTPEEIDKSFKDGVKADELIEGIGGIKDKSQADDWREKHRDITNGLIEDEKKRVVGSYTKKLKEIKEK